MFDTLVTHRERRDRPGGTVRKEPCECSVFRLRVHTSVRYVRFARYAQFVQRMQAMQAIFACRQSFMRYIVTSTHATSIWPGDLRGLTGALKQAMIQSKQWPDTVITLAIHEIGTHSVPFRKFKNQSEIWRSEATGDDYPV